MVEEAQLDCKGYRFEWGLKCTFIPSRSLIFKDRFHQVRFLQWLLHALLLLHIDSHFGGLLHFRYSISPSILICILVSVVYIDLCMVTIFVNLRLSLVSN